MTREGHPGSSGGFRPDDRHSSRERPRPTEPIAIVGMACRFPGAPDIPTLWRLLEEGGNAVAERLPGSGSRRVDELFDGAVRLDAACRFCAWVDDIDRFDAGFFRISPVEARLLDPQQRMMLETSWQALEDAGIDPDRLQGTRTGVYTGISNDEYRMLVLDSVRPAEAASSLYALSGTNLNGTSGRVSFVLGLTGPAKAVDAACASSLVSVHDAVADLQQGKADLAIAAGVQAILNGRVFELRADSMMLSPDGQCKAFDASANGYVRGEGCGVVVLKRLAEAEADGDRIWGVIRGAAVNHGGASVGLTVPNAPALEQVMETALEDAGITPAEVDYLEAHGTGTAVGDPIEINAVAAVYGGKREPDRPLLVGSVKTNVGHLESAAGIAGLIKAVLVAQRGVIPKHLHFRDPNPSLDWDRLPLRVTSSMMELPRRDGRPRVAGVNSFGISGTNAHIVVEEYRASDAPAYASDQVTGPARAVTVSLPAGTPRFPQLEPALRRRERQLLPLSGKSESALRDLAKRYLSWLDEREAAAATEDGSLDLLLSDMAWTAGTGRCHFDRRAGLVFADARELRDRLVRLVEAGPGAAPRPPTKVAFAYTGQGSQWVGMGRKLYETEPVARAVLDSCEAVFREERGASLLDVMFGADATEELGDTAWEQPALYALGCALTALWSSVGVEPAVVVGHSVGEIAAAQAAGVFSLEDGMRFAASRGTLLSKTGAGAMAAVFAAPARVEAAVEAANAASSGVGVSISADNGSHQVVSGPRADVETISKRFESTGVRVRRLNTTKAFHSALVEPGLDALEASLERVAVHPPVLGVVSNLTGRTVKPGQLLDGTYWRRHAREPVAFAGGVRTLAELGVDLIVEIGPRPVLAPMGASAWPDSAPRPAPTTLSSLHPPSADAAAGGGFVEAVAAAYEAGIPIRLDGLFAGETRRRISLPGYPFQRERYWLDAPKRRHAGMGDPLLGARRDSASGETTFETEVFPSDPEWLSDHRVFGRVIAPGALYGAMAASVSLSEESGPAVVEEMQLHSPLVFSEGESGEDAEVAGRSVQVVLGAPEEDASRPARILSRGPAEDGWTLHTECRIPLGTGAPEGAGRVDLEDLERTLSPVDVPSLYRARAGTGIDLGPAFRTLGRAWSRPGEALGEVRLPEASRRDRPEIHPLLLDGCFQVVAAARIRGEAEDTATYLPFGWERLWLTGRIPERVYCHVRMSGQPPGPEAETTEPAEVLTGELRLYDPDGVVLGGVDGYTVKRATPEALFSAVEGVDDLLYEVVWRERPLAPALVSADFLPDPATVAEGSAPLAEYLAEEGVAREDRSALLTDLERWSRSRALATLNELGWRPTVGEAVDSEKLRERLDVTSDHKRLFRRMFEMLASSGFLEESEDGFLVEVGADDRWPDEIPRDLEALPARMAELYPHGVTEIGLFRRCGAALAEVLRGHADPLTLLFSSGDPTPADLYLKAPIARAANRLLGEAVRTLVAGLPSGRRLRVIEVGAGTGSATAAVLPELPEGRFDYMYTDISAGFFAEAETRFGDGGGCIEYRPLDIEKDPTDQGFEAHGYDLLVASNVLHATRDLGETLDHCRRLLAPSGQLVALENLRGQGWMDLTFGQLDGWWRFADDYRPHHALASPEVWRRALADARFEEVEVLGLEDSSSAEMPDRGVIVAKGPVEVSEAPGAWVLTVDRGGVAAELASGLAARNQTVWLVTDGSSHKEAPETGAARVITVGLEFERRESWRSLLTGLADDVPLQGVVHLAALDGHGAQATTGEMAEDVRHGGASALALVQGLADSDLIPAKGVWFITRGAQVLERENLGQLAGATLWGFGKAVAREAPQLQPRMIDMDPAPIASAAGLLDELLCPDSEDHIAYRSGRRQAARLVRAGSGPERLELPEESAWALAPDPTGVFEKPCAVPVPARPLEPREVRVAVEAAGLNFWDVFRSLGFIEEGNLGREMCGRIAAVGSDVSSVSAGDQVVGLGFGAFAREMVTHEELVAPAPRGITATQLATVPSAFVSAALSFELSGLEPGDRVLIHAGAGGVGLAAIQLAQAAGAEVFATASAPKQGYLRSLGVEHVFDSRRTSFGEEISRATDGAGVTVVLNSLTGEGFIDASLSCLAEGGRFVELARRDILSEAEMAAARPNVAYDILELDVLKKTDPAWVGRVLRGVIQRISAGELEPLMHSRWPLAEAGRALAFMRSARHLGKIVVTAPPLLTGRLRADRTYLVTGGLGGIGCAVAAWLAERGAGVIVLNGRRPPDEEAEEAVRSLRESGATVRVEIADVSDPSAVDAMLARVDRELPPLGGVIHSVGVLSDGALANQSWERFESVLWPKVLGAWHMHRATTDLDLDLFVLFSSRVGVMGNPGQTNHAAANAFLDQLAGHRRALGLPGQSIAWGAWSEIGEAAEQRERIEGRRAALGGRWFTPEQGLKAFERLVRQDVTTSVVMSMDWSVFEDAVEDRPPFLEDLLTSAPDGDPDTEVSADDLLSHLGETAAVERERLLVPFLQQELKAVLRLPSLPDSSVGFFDLGMDSLMAVELRNRLNRALAGICTVSNTAVFDYPDIETLAHHLAGELGEPSPESAPELPPVPARLSPPEHADEPIAVVGMACRFPGAPDLSAFWRQLLAGTDAVTDGRPDSGPWRGVVGDPSTADRACRRGGFVEGLDRFDARFFGIRPIEARMMDPRQRMLLETSWHALEDAGIDPAPLKGSRAGVFAGLGASEYRDLIAATGRDDSYLGTAASVAIGRIAYALGLMGPAVPLDMTCASSLVAVHQAAASLRQGEIDLALAGGVHALLSPAVMRFMHEYGMLSRTGRCRPFDAAADGFVRGEGCGMVVLKRLSDAEADSDHIWGLVLGSAVNQNGASAALTVPNGTAQEQLFEAALSRAQVAPSEVDYLEVHGTGSELGDPIEVRAVAEVYGRGREAGRPLLLGTAKSNIGHLESAAGIAGLIKVLLAMRHGVIPKHLHLENPSPHMEWERLPVRVTTEATAWPPAPHRLPMAGISAFGISGTNAHLIVEGYGTPRDKAEEAGAEHLFAGPARPVSVASPESGGDLQPAGLAPGQRKTRLLPLSAKSDAALRDLAARYLSWLDRHAEELGSEGAAGESVLADLAWTAAIGRSHFAHRRGVVFDDSSSLRRGLASVAEAGGVAIRQPGRGLAFVYPGGGGDRLGMAEQLYESEPAVRTVLERCESVFRQERGGSLLEAMFGSADGRKDPVWKESAVYALECSLAALWTSVGIRPDVVCGSGTGEIAAAQTAGVVSLEAGAVLAARRGERLRAHGADSASDSPEALLQGVSLSSPSLPVVAGATGKVIASGETPDGPTWCRQILALPALAGGMAALANLDVGTIMHLDPGAAVSRIPATAWPRYADTIREEGGGAPPLVLSLSRRKSADAGPASEDAFVRAVALAYEAGLPLDFPGLFVGEARRRISLPVYPFQRRPFWFDG
ncbi:MAG: SDR family NAD(P)-dependent oxidoreductase [Gammaproteobacteria bacterium]|nr:SDR family NAD(P)-dependent oxidoreductase [Gammaproteobacteria bacterium]